MPLNLASPGIVVREVDLTTGRVTPASNKTGAIVAPFAQGPVDSPTLIENENDLLNTFGQSYNTDKHYENWLVASSYLAYGGSLNVVRADDTDLKNGFVPTTVGAATSVKIKSLAHYEELGYDENTLSGVVVAARNPGSWSNGINVAIIDSKADQILSGINTSGVVVTSFNTTVSTAGTVGTASTTLITGIATASISLGNTLKLKTGFVGSGVTVVGISTLNDGTITVNPALSNDQAYAGVNFEFGAYVDTTTSAPVLVGYGVTQTVVGKYAANGTALDGYLKGVVTEVGASKISVKVLSHVSAAGTETNVDYEPLGTYAFDSSGSVGLTTSGQTVSYGSTSYTSRLDWFDQQTILISGTAGGADEQTIYWNTIAPKPQTSEYAEARGSRFDEVHVVVVDRLGTISGNAGTIIEKHLTLSKAKDAEFSSGNPSYWRKYLANNSAYIFGLGAPTGIVTTGYSSAFNLVTNGGWDKDAEGIIFSAAGSSNNVLSGGKNYSGISTITVEGALDADVSELNDGYALFENTEQYKVDFLLMGSAAHSITDARTIANKLITVAELRKDCLAFISPYRASALVENPSQTTDSIRSSSDITDKVIEFYSPLPSSTYAVFDTGYKYTYDRFANTFRYVPLNGDIAGLCARNDVNNFPWYSPAGTTRGSILNAVKLPYNPSKTQRDKLYSNNINPVIFSPGSGIILFGDKTGYRRASAFDRINVRRLFVYLENAISAAAKDALFEFNDEITRTNFTNTVEPFLRDVQAKRGISDYVVVCDDTNNTAAVIDNGEFRADIYIKPARSINFIGLTFVATKTGVDFEEVIGNF